MQRLQFDDLPNPFSVESAQHHRPGPLGRRVKFLCLVAGLFVAALLLSNQYAKFRIGRLTYGFDALSSAEKQSRVDQLSSFGSPSIPAIVRALTDADKSVAEHAHQALHRMQNEWSVLPVDQAIENDERLVDCIQKSQAEMMEPAKAMAVQLLSAVAAGTVDQQGDQMRRVYFNATGLIDQLSAETPRRQSQSIAIDDAHRPLPVNHLHREADWTDWPPAASNPVVSVAKNADGPVNDGAAVSASRPTIGPRIQLVGKPRLQAVPPGEAVVLRELKPNRMHPAPVKPADSSPPHVSPETLQPVAHVIDTAWQQNDLAGLIKMLSTDSSDVRSGARAELVRRGLTDTELSIATTIASGDAREKINTIQLLSTSNGIDPRPWLLLLFDDDAREVRLRAVSALAALKDPWVKQQLRLRMVDEKDQAVVFRLRRVLNLR